MKSGVHLRSETGEPGCVTVNAEQGGRVFFCENVDSTCTIEGFTITGGTAVGPSPDDRGGGMFCTGCTFRLVNCRLTNNMASFSGGGMFCGSQSSIALSNVAFLENSADFYGGGVCCSDNTSPLFESVVFVRNSAGMRGGALYCYLYSGPILTQCTFLENWAAYKGGGGHCRDHSNARFTNCTFYANCAISGGGGVSCSSASSPALENSIIAFCPAGSAVWCDCGYCNMALACCDIYGNNGGDWVGSIADQCGINGNFSECPLFCDPDNGDFHLQVCSPCAPGNHPTGYACGLVGAFDVGCECGLPSRVQPTSWSSLKALYR
jgi:predicted outer membrane repeat protein